jgi:tellurite resistance-related uncharacterized protein
MTKIVYDYFHILVNEDVPAYMRYAVKGYDIWPPSSVMAGQVRINHLASFDSMEAAQAAYPEAELSHPMLEPVNTFDHLSDKDDEDLFPSNEDY